MPSPRNYSRAAKVMTASGVSLLLGFGLCGLGAGFDTRATQLQIVMSYAGALSGVVGLGLFLFACSEIGKSRRRGR